MRRLAPRSGRPGSRPPSRERSIRWSSTVWDADGDGSILVDEFLHSAEPASDQAKKRRRDFELFDADGDQKLSAAEFSGTPSDPFADMLADAVSAMDESFGGWQFRSDEKVDTNTFVINYAASISDGTRRLDRRLIQDADSNRDRQVSREEAFRFLQSQLAIRWIGGQWLRFDDGRVIDFGEFVRSDTNHNLELDQYEIAPQKARLLDADSDRKVTLNEYANVDGPNVRDPVQDFLVADANYDGGLDASELRQSVPWHRQRLIDSNLTAFDADGDQRLSLREYRLSMLGNYSLPWGSIPRDENRDRQLSFHEFTFDDQAYFDLLRRYYFHRLDRDGDGQLSVDEFAFRLQSVYSLYRVAVGGDGDVNGEADDLDRIYRDPNFPVVSSPDISNDGKSILFQATPPEGTNRSRIWRVRSDGSGGVDLCDGLMPSWSPDGKRFACSRYEGGSSVWIMKADGTADHRIDDGWSAQWSPDGKSVAYTNDNSIPRLRRRVETDSRRVGEAGSSLSVYLLEHGVVA